MLKQFFIVLSMVIFFLFPYNNAIGQSSYNEEIKQAAVSFINSLSTIQKRSALLAFQRYRKNKME